MPTAGSKENEYGALVGPRRQSVVMTVETEAERRWREKWRGLFDDVAGLYDATRQGYPEEIVNAVCATAGIGCGAAGAVGAEMGAKVLEIGCGTGQLTRQLAGGEFNLTAIDIGTAMVAAARRNVADPMVTFQVCSFEEFVGSGPFDLIVSATAFHWVDPAVGWAKAARLLRPGGWLALMSTGERYPEPLRTQLQELWDKYNRRIYRAASRPPWLAGLRESSLFGEPVELQDESELRLGAQTILGVERTRATFLSYSKQDQESFTADLAALLDPSSLVDVVQYTFLAMAPTVA
jgi:ubiquinone/menaquinone biosynthesis C-methylase UbiE